MSQDITTGGFTVGSELALPLVVENVEIVAIGRKAFLVKKEIWFLVPWPLSCLPFPAVRGTGVGRSIFLALRPLSGGSSFAVRSCEGAMFSFLSTAEDHSWDSLDWDTVPAVYSSSLVFFAMPEMGFCMHFPC